MSVFGISYYLGELSGKPHPIISPNDVSDYSGTLYRIVDLKPQAADYETMMSNIETGVLPNGVNVERDGREVLFRAWPYRCVLWSVWEFLEEQGVRWLFPDAQGDFVPVNSGVNLDVLPLKFTPSAKSIYANWDTSIFQPWPPWMKQSIRQGYLYPWRNRWTSSWEGSGPLGGEEIPKKVTSNSILNSDYSEGFSGYPHNFDSVVPIRILKEHPGWWGYSAEAGQRVDPETPNAPAFCMNHPELIDWVADKVIELSELEPMASIRPLDLTHFRDNYNFIPDDATSYCRCEEWCLPVNPTRPSGIAWVMSLEESHSGMYYNFVNEVAKRVKSAGSEAMIGALAYADVHGLPAEVDRLNDNVELEIALYGAPNLPMTSPVNREMKDILESWAGVYSRITTYDYALLHGDYWQPNFSLPVPIVGGTISRVKYLAQMNALDGGTQATPGSLPYNPWNFYAYPRIRWNLNQNADDVLQEFFAGYFKESSIPMLAYYRTLEEYHLENNVNMHFQGYSYGITPGSFPFGILSEMKEHLELAESLANNWYIKEGVARIREGFNWVLQQRGVNGVDLADLSSYPAVTENESFNVDIGSMNKAANGPLGNYAYWDDAGYWNFLAQGTINTTLNFSKPGTYKIIVRAKAVLHEDVYPILMVYIGGAMDAKTIGKTEYFDYEYQLAVPAMVLDLTLDYKNATSGGRRNILVQEIQIISE